MASSLAMPISAFSLAPPQHSKNNKILTSQSLFTNPKIKPQAYKLVDKPMYHVFKKSQDVLKSDEGWYGNFTKQDDGWQRPFDKNQNEEQYKLSSKHQDEGWQCVFAKLQDKGWQCVFAKHKNEGL
ncbi:hypothetical protein LINPERHAP1_LOCUS3458, partial [Linum perenne]